LCWELLLTLVHWCMLCTNSSSSSSRCDMVSHVHANIIGLLSLVYFVSEFIGVWSGNQRITSGACMCTPLAATLFGTPFKYPLSGSSSHSLKYTLSLLGWSSKCMVEVC
jgi:hypothetical protein